MLNITTPQIKIFISKLFEVLCRRKKRLMIRIVLEPSVPSLLTIQINCVLQILTSKFLFQGAGNYFQNAKF